MEKAFESLDINKFDKFNREFHRVLYSSSNNEKLVTLLDQMWKQLDTIRHNIFYLIPQLGASSLNEHKIIISLIESRASAEKIEKFVRKHKMRTIEALRKYNYQKVNYK